MPVMIPPEVVPVLSSLGIQNPENSHWKRHEPWPARRIRAHIYCPCSTPNLRVELTHTWLGNRQVFIGQCSACQTICWRDAIKE